MFPYLRGWCGELLPEQLDPLQTCQQQLAAFEKKRADLGRLDLQVQFLEAKNRQRNLRNWAPSYLEKLSARRENVKQQMTSLLAKKMAMLSLEEENVKQQMASLLAKKMALLSLEEEGRE